MKFIIAGLKKSHIFLLTEGFLIGAYIKQYLAVEGMTVSFNNSSHTGDISLGSPSEKADDCNGNRCYLDNLQVTITNGSDGNTTMNATGTGLLNATTRFITLEDEKPLRQTDKNNTSILMTGVSITPPYNPSVYYTDIRITNAGQNKVRSA